MAKLRKFGIHLRGLDPDSEALKGHTVYLLESIMKRMGESSHRTSAFGNNSTSSGSCRHSLGGTKLNSLMEEAVDDKGKVL